MFGLNVLEETQLTAKLSKKMQYKNKNGQIWKL